MWWLLALGVLGAWGVTSSTHSDYCVNRYGGMELDYTEGDATTFQFDLCDVFDCAGRDNNWRGYDVYLCAVPVIQADCHRQSKPCGAGGCQTFCSDWGQAVGYTGRWSPKYTYGDAHKASLLSLQRGQLKATGSGTSNPLLLTIRQLRGGFFTDSHSSSTVLYLILGVEVSGTDPSRIIKINLKQPSPVTAAPTVSIPVRSQAPTATARVPVIKIDYSSLSPEEVLTMATGYADNNLWLEWLMQNAREQTLGDCIACASARPALFTSPAPLFPDKDPAGYACMTGLTHGHKTAKCTTLAVVFPPINNKTTTGPFQPNRADGGYVCYDFSRGNTHIGDVPPDWCNETRHGSEIGMWARGGLYFYCGRQQLWVVVPTGASGRCAMVRLTSPVLLLGTHLNHTKTRPRGTSRRRRRDTYQFDLTYGSPTYIDAIGIPRGVPNEYKLADQIAAGFENIPVLSALFPVTPSKNVDRINFIHYNVLRLANMTRDAVEGLAEQLAPTSLMAVQNRMALDMLLAEKGGVCSMFGEMCCTFIPNNTAPDGKVTRALDGLRALSKEMHEASGVDNAVSGWMENMFGKWKDLVMSILISLATFVAVLVTCGCFCVPCIRSLCVRCITSTIESKQPGNPPPYQMPLLASVPLLDSEDGEEEDPCDYLVGSANLEACHLRHTEETGM